jgi:hypothetical protein
MRLVPQSINDVLFHFDDDVDIAFDQCHHAPDPR